MQNQLDDNDFLMHSAHNEGKLVVAERSTKILKGEIYKRMTANESKSYTSYLNKLENQCNSTYHRSIDKKSINVDYSDLTEEIKSSHTALKFKIGDQDY